MYKIEKGIKPPNTTVTSKYPFAEMNVGDSFVVDTATERQNTYSAAIYYGRKHNGFKISSAKEGNKYRIWRVA